MRTKMSHKKLIELNQDHFEAIFFVEGKRVLTYGGVTRMQIVLMLQERQLAHAAPVTVYIIDEVEAMRMGNAVTLLRDQADFMAAVKEFRTK